MSGDSFDRAAYRSWLRTMFGERADEIARRLDKILNAERRVRRPFTCSECGHSERKDVSVRDDRLLLDFLKWVGEHGFGRPPADDGGGVQTFELVNQISLVGCERCSCEDCRERQDRE